MTGGFEQTSTATLTTIAANLRRGLDVIADTLAEGTFNTVGPKGAAPPAQAGQLTLALLDGVQAELARRSTTHSLGPTDAEEQPVTDLPRPDYSGPCPSCSRPNAVHADGSIPPHPVYGLASPCDAPPSLLPHPAAPNGCPSCD